MTDRSSRSSIAAASRNAVDLLTGPGGWTPVIALSVAAWCMLFLPTYADLAATVWAVEEQTFGPLILVAAAWLLYSDLRSGQLIERRPRPGIAFSLIALALALYILGRSQGIMRFESVSQIPMLAGLLLLFLGKAAIGRSWASLLLLAFTVPLPGELVATLTGPLKAAVSWVSTGLLHSLGYPVARSGVIISIGQYQLLVADACAGLSSIFTLEALGIIYMRLVGHTDSWRNVCLAALLLPVAFISNVVRVVVLILVTFHFGADAGQGFVHDFAGLVLFVVATSLMLVLDKALGIAFRMPLPSR